MNVHASSSRQAERARLQGDVIYKKLLPELKKDGVADGHFVAINVDTGTYVTGATRLDLMTAYKKQFGHTLGWVKRIEYGEDD